MQQYKGEQPFSLFLKSFFGQYKKYGSKDRKQISHLCYCYFRLGLSLQELPIEERILAGLFLCGFEPNELLEELQPVFNQNISMNLNEKISMLNFSMEDIFPGQQELSEGVDYQKFCKSFLIQPELFVRLRPGHEKEVIQKFQTAGLPFTEIPPACLALTNAAKVDKLVELDKEAVVQDYNSQRVAEFLNYARNFTSPPSTTLRVYDCCAASGGKSILAYDVLGNIELTVSDLRESILINLKKRFERAGIKNYASFAADLSTENRQRSTAKYDLIICDAPCTGSGTWSRTPEELYYFRQEKIDHYSNLQKRILQNVIPGLKKGGYLLYITCSVFRKENEEIVQFIRSGFKLKLEKMEVLKGYDKKADTLFAALLQT